MRYRIAHAAREEMRGNGCISPISHEHVSSSNPPVSICAPALSTLEGGNFIRFDSTVPVDQAISPPVIARHAIRLTGPPWGLSASTATPVKPAAMAAPKLQVKLWTFRMELSSRTVQTG